MGIKIAIIGSGPAAFYTAQSILKADIEKKQVDFSLID